MTADDAVAAKSKPGPLPLTKAGCREIFEMETMLTAWLRIYGDVVVETRPPHTEDPVYWLALPEIKMIISREDKFHQDGLRTVVVEIVEVHRKFYSQEFLPAVARWREIAPGKPVPTDKEV
jgi:hypothetical protein